VTFKYGLGEEFIGVLRTLNLLGLDSTEPIDVRGAKVAPRDVVAAALPDPATLGDRMSGRTGVLGPEAFDAVPFLDKLAELGTPHGVDERDPANPLSR
jgi:hypothetical protein